MEVSKPGEGGSEGSASGSDEDDASMSEEGSGSGSSDGSEGSDDEGSEGSSSKGKGKPAGSKKAAAAMAVGVGSFSDPPDMQGLSHYLEHMLFMGSEKFPDENEYDSFLTKHGGASNAFTELEFTNYHFEVAPASLQGALDRFAQFFVAPLFKAGALEREVQAVDSEFKGVLQSDHSRLSQLMCHTAKPGHIYNKFSWGNLASLWEQPRQAGLDVRQRIIDYYRHEYGPARMSLVLLGGQTLDTLEAWVRELFDPVPRGLAGPPPSFSGAGQPFEGRVLYVAPAVKEHHEVTVTFQLPCLRQQYTNKPDHYISHLVGHEGPGSLLSALKARGWALELCAGVDDDGYSCNSATYLFSVSIVLTEAGLAAGPGCGLGPVDLLFQYLRLLNNTGPQRWVWEELQAISGMKFRFVEEEDSCELVTRLASTLGWVAPQHLLVADYLHESWQPDKVCELLDCMHPTSSSYRIDLLTKSFSTIKQQLQQHNQAAAGDSSSTSSCVLLGSSSIGSSGSSTLQVLVEPWFNMEALAVQLPASLTVRWQQCEIATDLALPPANPYLPSDFTLKSEGQAAQQLEGAATGNAAAAAAADKGEQQQQQQVLQGVESWVLVAAAPKPEVVLALPPAMLVDEPGLRVWHKLAVSYSQPRVSGYFRLSGPAAAASPAAAVLGALWLRLVEESLAEDAYLADVAGLHWSSSPEGLSGFEVRCDGFSHKLDVLAGRVFDCLAACKVRPQTFPAVHEQLLRRYRNALLSPSKAAAALRLSCLSGGPHWNHDQLAAAAEAVKGVEEVQAFAAQFLSCCHLECLMIGNITASEATSLSRHLTHTLAATPSSPTSPTQPNGSSAAGRDSGGAVGDSGGAGVGGVKLPAGERPQERCVVLPSGVALLHRVPARNPEEDNCCVEVYYQIGLSSDLRLRVLTDLVDQVLFEPLYDSLRTKQQLGYSVSSGARLTHGVSGFCVCVVSAAFGAEEVEGRIEAFLQDFQTVLQAMPDEEFQRHKSALTSNKLQRDTSLGQEGDRTWEQVFNTRYEFLCKEQEAALLQQVSLAELQQFYDTYLAPSSEQRRKLAVQVVPTKQQQQEGKGQEQQQGEGIKGKGAGEQQQQQHVQHEHGMHHQQPGHHMVGAAVVHAGGEQQQQEVQEADDSGLLGGDADAAVNHPGTPKGRPGAKRQRRSQQLPEPTAAAAAGASSAAALLAPGVQVQLVADPDEFKQGRERYPVYCTVKPVLASH